MHGGGCDWALKFILENKHLSMAVVVRNSLVPIQKRYRKNMGLVFEFPGGAVDDGESGVVAAARELKEETSLADLALLGRHELKNEFGGFIHFVLFSGIDGVEPQATDVALRQEFHWMQVEKIPRDYFYAADLEFIDTCLRKYI